MSDSFSLTPCNSPGDVADLFSKLGYPVNLQRISVEAWRQAGILWECAPGQELYHLFTGGGVELLMLRSDIPIQESGAYELISILQSLNAILKYILIYADNQHSRLALLGLAGARPQRLDIECAAPRRESLDRLCSLSLEKTPPSSDLRKVFTRALDRESLSRTFFTRFRTDLEAVQKSLEESCPGESPESLRSEALLILSRVLFLYFVQEKGWLDCDRRYLIHLFERAAAGRLVFFSEMLLPLFFGCLNTPVQDRSAAAERLGAIPYLNGGLFQPSEYELRNPSMKIADDVLYGTLDGTFERFSFSVDEKDQSGAHIDPVMLGKVFESLMAADERLSSGSFYTPRAIVDTLTERAILRWCGGDSAALSAALSSCETAAREDALAILEKLRRITVLDPACGSGAFLLSALHVIERLTRRFSIAAGVEVPATLRQQIVERSLFGVDLKPEAVRLCELRLWLAIVSDSDRDIDSVEPLPNLDRNILQGNSLLSPLDFLGNATREVYAQWSHALHARADLLAEYRHAPASRRPAIYQEIRESDRSLALALLQKAIAFYAREIELVGSHQRLFPGNGHGRTVAITRYEVEIRSRLDDLGKTLDRVKKGENDFFSYEVHFGDVMSQGGFDVVLGNPPWVRGSRLDPHLRAQLRDRYRSFSGRRNKPAAFPQTELAVAFCERALELTSSGGIMSLLLPAKILNASYGAELRAELALHHQLISLDDWSESSRAHFEADTFPLGLTVRKMRAPAEAVEVSSGDMRFELSQAELTRRLGEPWILREPQTTAFIRSLEQRFRSTSDQLRRKPVMGVKTGRNGVWFLPDLEFRDGKASLPGRGIEIPVEFLCRMVRGRDIRRWRAQASTWMLWPPAGGFVSNPPEWLIRFAESSATDPSELRLSYVQAEHLGIKVVWKDVAKRMEAVVLPATTWIEGVEFPLIPNQTAYALDCASFEEAYVMAAVFNSALFHTLVTARAERAKDSHYRFFAATVARVPLPPIDPAGDEFSRLVRLSRRAHRGDDVDAEIEAEVESLYGVEGGELVQRGEPRRDVSLS